MPASDNFDPRTADWLHGTDVGFAAWRFPPPPKPGQGTLVPHSAVFLTTHVDYAEGAGSGLCRARLLQDANLLDATRESQKGLRLRAEVLKNRLAQYCIYLESEEAWLRSWQNGEVLRFAYANPAVNLHVEQIVRQLQSKGMARPMAEAVAQHNMTRGWIELICVAARNIGIGALYGHEVDRHTGTAQIARPWLAVLKGGVISAPEWIREPATQAAQT